MHLAFISQTSAYHKLAEKQAFFSSLLVGSGLTVIRFAL